MMIIIILFNFFIGVEKSIRGAHLAMLDRQVDFAGANLTMFDKLMLVELKLLIASAITSKIFR